MDEVFRIESGTGYDVFTHVHVVMMLLLIAAAISCGLILFSADPGYQLARFQSGCGVGRISWPPRGRGRLEGGVFVVTQPQGCVGIGAARSPLCSAWAGVAGHHPPTGRPATVRSREPAS